MLKNLSIALMVEYDIEDIKIFTNWKKIDVNICEIIIYFYFLFIYFSELLKKISSVTIDDLKSVGERHFMKMFDPSVFSSTLCCHPTKIDEILESFNEWVLFVLDFVLEVLVSCYIKYDSNL